jgi:hypothetical protein
MGIIGADGVHVGTVDAIVGNRINLMKTDNGEAVHKATVTSSNRVRLTLR